MNYKVGVIGMGNMATAIIKGAIEQGALQCEDVIVSRRSVVSLESIEEHLGVETTTDNIAVVNQSTYILLAVKPQFMAEVIAEIKDCITENHVIISIAAGKTMEWYETEFGKKISLIRCMPNTPALVGEACTAYCFLNGVSSADISTFKCIFGAVGKVHEIQERLMDAVIGVSGSSPAYVYMMIEAMADGAVAAGMMREQAYEMAAQAVYGSAKMVLETKKHPGELKDMVCSPGGTTIEAVEVLEKKGFRAALMEAMKACIERSKAL